MLFTYGECEARFGSYYRINKAIHDGILYKLENGVYSDTKQVSEIEVIGFKYPHAVFTLNSAFYYHGLTDVIPDQYVLATSKDAHKIRDARVKQVFCRDEKYSTGITVMDYQGIAIRIYDRERMLIELIRYANKLPFDYYKEIIESYRRTVYTLDIQKLQEYLSVFLKGNAIMEAIELEVL